VNIKNESKRNENGIVKDGCIALAAPIAPDHHQLIVQIESSNECEEDRKDSREANNGMLYRGSSRIMRVLYFRIYICLCRVAPIT
jgi:hypothetical protein